MLVRPNTRVYVGNRLGCYPCDYNIVLVITEVMKSGCRLTGRRADERLFGVFGGEFPRMVLFNGFFQVLGVQARIDRGRRDTLMAEKLLKVDNRGPRPKHVQRAGVP